MILMPLYFNPPYIQICTVVECPALGCVLTLNSPPQEDIRELRGELVDNIKDIRGGLVHNTVSYTFVIWGTSGLL